ncbi:MAG: YhbY family RNA-binding protein [Nanoarchaeota archaeon]
MNKTYMEPMLRIGKKGITDEVIKEVKIMLDKKKIVKVKFLRTAITKNKKELIEELAIKTGSRLVKAVGFVVVLQKI